MPLPGVLPDSIGRTEAMVRVSPPPGLCPLAALSGSPGVNWTASGFAPHPTFDGNDPTLGGLGNRIFNLIDLGERRGRKWQGRAALRLPDKPERVRLFDRLPRAARPAAGITELGPPARLPVSNHIQVNLSGDQSGCGHEANSGTRDGRGRLSGDGVSRVRHG